MGANIRWLQSPLVYTLNLVAGELKGIIFDVDGTMYRQFPVRTRMALRLLSHCSRKPAEGVATFRLIRAYRHIQEELRDTGWSDDQLRLACERASIDPAWGASCIATWIHERPLDLVSESVYPDLLPFLERAGKEGLRLGVFSDYPAEKKLAALGIRRFFSYVVDASDQRVRQFKPAPRGILTALDGLHLEARHALYIGDRPSVDGEAARRAGVRCIIIGSSQARSGSGWSGVPDYATLGRVLGLA